MNLKYRRILVGLCATTAVGAAVVLPAVSGADTTSTAAAPAPEVPSAAQLSGLSAAEVTLLNNLSQPKTIVMDPTTGDILSVTANSTATDTSLNPDITHTSGCSGTQACYVTNTVPYANQGFSGDGTSTGSWPRRSGYTSGNWTVEGCWSSSCGPEVGPNSTVTFTSDVTGTSFTIYS